MSPLPVKYPPDHPHVAARIARLVLAAPGGYAPANAMHFWLLKD
jgi:hypothetical protein